MHRRLAAVSLPVLALLTLSLPVAAEVAHTIEGRFGVGYSSTSASGQSAPQPLYEGRYTSTFTQRTDNGLTFRFELGVIVGNLPERGERYRPAHGSASVGVGRD